MPISRSISVIFPWILAFFGPILGLSGPAPGLSWTHIGPGGGGWIQALTADPRDPDTLYLGCDVGGFYISRDAGRSWTIQNAGLTDYFVQSIAVSPADSRILLLGMEGGIFKSTDQGMTWQGKRQGFPEPERYSFSAPIGALCFDPTRPNTLYAGIGRPRWDNGGKGQVYKSEDCGETWRLITPPGALPADALISDLRVAPDGSYLLAATTRGLYRTTDGGATWAAGNQGLGHTHAQKVAIAPSNPQIAYCTLRTTARDARPWDGGVWRSEDGGKTWARRSNGLATRVGKTDEAAEMTSNVREIAVDPRDPDTVYVGDWAWVSAGVYKTTDGGLNWSQVTDHYSPKRNMARGWITQWGPTVECLTLSAAKPDRLTFGTSGMVFLTENGGKSWDQRYCRELGDGRFTGTGLEVTCFNDCVPDPWDPARVYFCFFDIGLLISDDRGESFRTSYEGMKASGNCFTVAFDPTDRSKLWAATGQWAWNEGYVCKSVDRGASWTAVGQPESGLPKAAVRSLLVDPASPPGKRRLYAASRDNGVYRSEDDGARWQAANGGLPQAARREPCRLLMDPGDPRHLRLALGGNPPGGSGIYETRDGAENWAKISRGAPLADLYDFAADPTHFDTLYLCQREKYDRSLTPPQLFPGGLSRSTDGGATWERIYDFHFASCVAVSPRDRRVIYLGTTDHPYHDGCRAQGVLVSRDGGKTWRQEVQGMSCWNISCLRVDPHDPTRLWVGTGGNGGFVGVDHGLGK